MKYSNHYKSRLFRYAAIAFLIFWFCGFGTGFVVIFCSAAAEFSAGAVLTCAIMLIIMLAGPAVAAYIILHTISEIGLDSGEVTFTYLTGRKETVAVDDITRVKVSSSGYSFFTAKKEYAVAVKFNYASMVHEEIGFVTPSNFPNAEFKKGMF